MIDADIADLAQKAVVGCCRVSQKAMAVLGRAGDGTAISFTGALSLTA
jgi:hypothetical protein